MDRSSLRLGPGGDYTIQAATWGELEDLCADERFANQPAPGWCTAFLVAPDLLVTAGHCLRDPDICESVAFVFGFQMLDEDRAVTSVPASQVYYCAEILSLTDEGDDDWGIVRLDRPVEVTVNARLEFWF